MGIVLDYSQPLPARPAYFDRLEVFEAADGASLHVVTMRKKDAPYYLFRYTYKALNRALEWAWKLGLLERPVLVKNPLPFEFQGVWDDYGKAEEHRRLLLEEARERGVRVGVNIGPAAVNRAFPFESVRWGGLTDPGALLSGRERGPALRSKLVPESEDEALRAELREWREGERGGDAGARTVALLEEANERLARLEDRLSDLERKGGPCVPRDGAT